jgi:hypothetical protein
MFLAAEPVGLALPAQPVRAGNASHRDPSALKGPFNVNAKNGPYRPE